MRGAGGRGVRCAIVAALVVGGCTFRPLYAEDRDGHSTRDDVAAIEVSQIGNGRVGQVLRNNLVQELTPRGEPAAPEYRLDVTLSDTLTDLLVQQDSEVLRRNYSLTASYRLVDTSTGRQVASARTTRTSSFNRVESEYANLIAERDAQRRTADAIAQVMAQRLGVTIAGLPSPEDRAAAAQREAERAAQPDPSSATPPQPLDIPPSAPPRRTTIETRPTLTPSVAPPAPQTSEPQASEPETPAPKTPEPETPEPETRTPQRFPDPVAIDAAL